MNQAVHGYAESDHLNTELSPEEEKMLDHIMDSGRGIDSHGAYAEVLQSRREKALATGPIALQETVEIVETKTKPKKRLHTYRGGGRGLHQKSDSEIGPFALEETGIVNHTDEQRAAIEDFRQENEMDYAERLLSLGRSYVEVTALLRARQEIRERGLKR